MKIHNNSGNNNGGDFKNVLDCIGEMDSRSKHIAVDLIWQYDKVGNKDHEYQRF